MTQPEEEAVRHAAALTTHWLNHDIEAVILLLADLSLPDDAQDLIISLLLIRDRTPDQVRRMITRSIWETT